MKLKDLLELLDPMTQLRIVCYMEREYYSRPLDMWENPASYEKDLVREVIKLDPETLNGTPVLMVGLETETHLKDRERTDKMFRPGGMDYGFWHGITGKDRSALNSDPCLF